MSGIYIHGLSMPRKTGIVSIVLSGDGSALLCEDGAYSEIKAMPVPEHGRLGDLDVLAKEIEYARFHHSHTDGLAARHHVTEYGHLLKALSDCPTIIPADKEGEG